MKKTSKEYAVRYLPKYFKNNIDNFLNNQKITNYYKTNYNKTALLSYITSPFKRRYLSHTNYLEAQSWAKILHELGYNVDVINYNSNKTVDFSKYQLICGFGDVFQQYFENEDNNKIKTIYYGTGMHVCYQNNATLKRVKDVYNKKGVWLSKSARFVEKTWTHQTTLVNGIIALGNSVCADSYKKYYHGKIFSVPAPFYKIVNTSKIINRRSKDAGKNFLWFGSSGLIHKGLDLVLEYFVKHPELTLHICGAIKNEPAFLNVYKKELYKTTNIIVHNFVDIKSKLFADILKKCSFVIYPSCSEGGSPAVLTVIGNGALIPIISKETTVTTGGEIWIDELSYDGIDKAVKDVLDLNNKQITVLQKINYEFVEQHNSLQNYYKELKKAIVNILA